MYVHQNSGYSRDNQSMVDNQLGDLTKLLNEW
jgi:hypothetical protein